VLPISVGALKRVAIVCLIDSRQIGGVATQTTNCHYMFVLIPSIFHAIEVTSIDLSECPLTIFNPNALSQSKFEAFAGNVA
jgi:hypothetical protein